MDSPSAILSSPAKVLNPVSPERMNQQTMPPSPSPSRPSDIMGVHRKSRGLSDVQAKVAFLNNLSRGNSPSPAQTQQSAGNTAALQRAILGREEAESALRIASEQLSEAQSREHRIGERLETLLAELQSAKERQSNERSIFEKEIKKARKDAFRAGSAVVKIQEDLKEARAEIKSLREETQVEREAKDEAKQEAFERAYTLAGLMEEMEVLKKRLRASETAIHSNRLESRAQNFGRMSLADGDLALLTTPTPRRPKRSADATILYSTNDSSTQCTPPKRPRLSDITPKQEEPQNQQEAKQQDLQNDMIEELQRLLDHEKQRRTDAEEMIHFMEMECQFKRCSCRLAEDSENTCIHETTLSQKKQESEVNEAPHGKREHIVPEPSKTQPARHSLRRSVHKPQHAMDVDNQVKHEEDMEVPVIAFSPQTGTFRAMPSPQRPLEKTFIPVHPTAFESHADEESFTQLPLARGPTERRSNLHDIDFERYPHAPPQVPSRVPYTPSPSTALNRATQDSRMSAEQSTEFELDTSGYPITKRVPLRPESRLSNQSAIVPGTPVSREEALAQIRARRGRANSTKRSASAGEGLFKTAAPAASSLNRHPPQNERNDQRRSYHR